MKKIFIAGLIAGMFGGFFVGNMTAAIPDIEIRSDQGTVVGIQRSGHAYVVTVECECWHGCIKRGFSLYTSRAYRIGDTIKFE